jgi:hypothetical protein
LKPSVFTGWNVLGISNENQSELEELGVELAALAVLLGDGKFVGLVVALV